MADQLIPVRITLRDTDADQTPLAGGSALFVRAGTMERVAIYEDEALTTTMANPVIADSLGRIPAVWFNTDVATDCYVYDADGVRKDFLENVPRWGAALRTAVGISFTAQDNLDADDVQEALEVLADALETESTGPRSVATGGTGGRNQDEARDGLGLGTAAVLDAVADTDFATFQAQVPTRAGVVAYLDSRIDDDPDFSTFQLFLPTRGAVEDYLDSRIADTTDFTLTPLQIPTRGAVANYVASRTNASTDFTTYLSFLPTREAVAGYVDTRVDGSTDFTNNGTDIPTRVGVVNYLASQVLGSTDFTVSGTLIPTRVGVVNYLASQVVGSTDFSVSGSFIPTRVAVVNYLASRVWTSAQQTITSGGALNLAHGLGVRPSSVRFFLVAQNAVSGYNTGDWLAIDLNHSDATTTRNNTCVVTGTQVQFRFTDAVSCFTTGNFATGVSVALTNTDWRLVIIAEV